ncbi:hypothetical protein T4D_12328 [Trichinella pseudospiralis]|uniref:Uncharacterized protein n=1 Tax=Trichinella pseudospiralis TaxID=6337 RepID=A0A0V1FKY3_TRIPS|nr:hypothetical protein T4D_12328 [Trichinella pseudospiralis]
MRYTKSSPHIPIKAIENTSTKCLGSCERKGDGSRPINKHGHKDPGSLRNPGLAKSHLCTMPNTKKNKYTDNEYS